MINPFKNKKGLGRGLSSLIGDSDIKDNNTTISNNLTNNLLYQTSSLFGTSS